MKVEAKLYLTIEFDDENTDAESVASALDKIMDASLSTFGILDEYGDPGIGKFFVDEGDAQGDGRS
jgi:hypothetical protein